MQSLVTLQNLRYLLKDARKRRGLTQAQVAQEVGLDQAVISRIERGTHNMQVETLFRLLAALEIELTMSSKGPKENNQADTEW
jgi:HTH-type transcriptional regulator/antitoxin HipB